jgi:hypothetical protein
MKKNGPVVFEKIVFSKTFLPLPVSSGPKAENWSTFKGAWYEKSFYYDWLSLSIQVGLILIYAISNIVYK